MRKLLSLVAVVMVTTFTFAQKTLVSDAAHSRIQFIVTHLGINDITGNLDKADLTFKLDEKNFLNSNISFEADVNTINTHIEARDNHLKSADFFDVAKYPKMVFVGRSITKGKMKNYYKVSGDLTIHGVTKPVSLVLVNRGKTVNPMSKADTYAFQVMGTIKRSDFQVGANFPEAIISDLVRIKGDFELVEKK